jgi:molybdopterin-containing oxidoreductase family iron-sulfur binding subunit
MTNEIRMTNGESTPDAAKFPAAELARAPAGEVADPKSRDFGDAAVDDPTNLRVSPSLRSPLPAGYWRSLDELADTEEFREWLHREFPREAAVWDDRAIDRRRFLQVMAASFAFASFTAGCANQGEEKIVPYVHAPAGVVPGKPRYFATAMPLGRHTLGVVATSREGRPIKIDGNELHPASLGATHAWAQASILSLYDPDRSQTVLHFGEISTWDAFLAGLRGALEPQGTAEGAGVFVLSETIASPTLSRQMQAFKKRYPQARWYQYEPICGDTERQGAQLAFGQEATPIYDFTQAKVVVSLDADFLCGEPGAVRYARDFMDRRKVRDDQAEMNRFFMVESTCTATGTSADHRLPLSPQGVGRFAIALARQLGVPLFESLENGLADDKRSDQADSIPDDWLRAVAGDLDGNRGAGIVLAGSQQPAWVHAAVHAINAHLGNHGKTVRLIPPVAAEPTNCYESLADLVGEMKAGRVEVLVILGGNPVYNAPRALGFGDALVKATEQKKTTVHLGLYVDETSALCRWHIPATHYLESWSDVRAFDGTASIVQPLIDPLYRGRSAHEVVSALTDSAVQPAYDLVRATWQESRAEGFEPFWRRAVHDGVVEDTAFEPMSATLTLTSEALLKAIEDSTSNQADDGGLAISILPDPMVYDGRFANNAWLQELPKPITKLTWENAILLSPAGAARLGVNSEDRVRLAYRERSVEGTVWIVPGHPQNSLTVYLGYGRRRGGRVLEDAGFDAFELLPASGLRIGTGATIEPLGTKHPLAATQHHHLLEDVDVLEGRDIIHAGTLEDFRRDEHTVHAASHHGEGEPLTLYPGYDYSNGLQWGMAIDLTACIGCNACVAACQAENNVPVVGKQGVINGREMHWLRLDLYYQGEKENPQAVYQPMLCQHCEKAPCEVVCPVMATTHSAEGLNEMTYNRCVGTRFCSNNCPYKVRRFNFFEYADVADPIKKLVFNPEVTVRSRGVMEKCTYCVQRISAARVAAKIEQVENGGELAIEDGSLQTACQQACPTEAIVFGNINDPNSQVARLKAGPLNYGVLSELGTQPRTTYLARLRNPHPELI